MPGAPDQGGDPDPHSQADTDGAPQVDVAVMRAGDGDCVLIRCIDGLRNFNILVDGGRAEAVGNLVAFLETLPESDRTIDLFVLTHIDADHIEGALAITRNEYLRRLVREVWFNDAARCAAAGAVALSTGQGDDFTASIAACRWSWNARFAGKAVVRAAEPVVVQLSRSTRLHLLGPTTAALRRLAHDWPIQELKDLTRSEDLHGAVEMGNARVPDVASLAASKHSEDDSSTNGSCIAFVLEHGDLRILVAADTHAEDLVAALEEQDDARPVRFDLAFLPHHGADANTSPALASLIYSDRWFISTTGARHRHPAPQSIARVLARRPDGHPLTLLFNSRHPEAAIWDDPFLKRDYRYDVVLPTDRQRRWMTLRIAK